VRIRNFVHKGLKRLYEDDDARAVPGGSVDKLRKMLAYLDEMEDAGELGLLPGWKPHALTGNRKGVWSLLGSRNWRLTFRVDRTEGEVVDVNLEDYH
jgi:proteic killer suppression protein